MTRAPADVVAALRELADVSRETVEQLEIYVDRLLDWQPRVNLVGASTLPDVWRRHVLNSAQVMPLIRPQSSRLVDLGSGAGLPGLVLAILGARGVELIEADARKASFLAEAAGVTGAGVIVRNERIEDLRGPQADTVTARALAPLPGLLEFARPFGHAGTRCILLKGARYEAELTNAYKMWKMTVDVVPSITDKHGRILVIEGLSHVARNAASDGTTARPRHRQPKGRRR